jgi:membrane complex biogenesis BtpA family protein
MQSKLFNRQHAVIGVVHLPPLPGSPHWNGTWKDVVHRAFVDTETLASGGVDAVIIENYGDTPFAKGAVPAATVSALTSVIERIPALKHLPFGVNVLRNDGASALAIAAVTGASFVRINVLVGAMVTDQGLIEGCAREVALLQRQLGSKVGVWADVLVKHAAPLAPSDPVQVAKDTLYRGGASALIVSGTGTGEAVDVERLRTLRAAGLGAPLLIGSGSRIEDLPKLKPLCDGFIVASSLKEPATGRPDLKRVRAFVEACRAA